MSSSSNNNTDIDSAFKNNVKAVKNKILATNQVFKLVRGAKSKLDDTCKKNEELEQQLAELRTALASAKEESATKINTLTAELTQAKSQLTQKNMYVQQLEAKTSELQQLCEQQKTDLSAGKAKEKQKQELTKKNNEVKTLQTKLKEAYTQVEELKRENESLQEKTNELEEENMVLKIEKDMDSMDEDEARMENVDHSEELAALRKELEQSKETSSALIEAEKERAAKLDKLSSDMKKLSDRNMELERAELKYQRELEAYKRRVPKPESSNKNYEELIKTNEGLSAQVKILYEEHETFTTKIHDLEDMNRSLKQEALNYKTKYQDLKSKVGSLPNNSGSPSTSPSSSLRSRRSQRQISNVTLKLMQNLKTELAQVKLEKQLLMDFVMREKMSKDKTMEELVLSSSSESGEEVQPHWGATNDLLLFDSFNHFSPEAPTSNASSIKSITSSRQVSNTSSSSSSSSSTKSPNSSVRSNSNASSSSSGDSDSPARQSSMSSMTYTTPASIHTKNATTASSISPSSSTTTSVHPLTSEKGSMPPPAMHTSTSPARPGAPQRKSSAVPMKVSPPLAQRNGSYGSSGLIAPPSILPITKPAPKKKASSNKLVRFANSRNPSKFISSAALPAPMTPPELIRVDGNKVTIVNRPAKRTLEEVDENQPPQLRSRMNTSPVNTSPTSAKSASATSPAGTTVTTPTRTSPTVALPTAISPTSASPAAISPTAASPAGTSPTSTAAVTSTTITTPKPVASTSTATSQQATTPTAAMPDTHVNKKRKVEGGLLKSIEESLQTCTLIDLDQVTFKDIDKAFIELIDSFSSMKTGISPEASPESAFGIRGRFMIEAPNNFNKGEKEYAWYLSYLSTKEPLYDYIMTAIVGKINFDVQCTKRDGVIARWFRLAAMITRSRKDGDKMVSILCDLAGTSGGKRFFCKSVLNVARGFPSCLKSSSPSIPNLSRTVQAALAHIANRTGSANAASTYTKIAPLLGWPSLSEATPLNSLADENLALINDVVKLNTVTNNKEYEKARSDLGHSLKVIFNMLNDWKDCYNGVIIKKLWPRLAEGGDRTLTEVVVHLLGCLGSLGVSEDAMGEEKAGLDYMRNTLSQLVEMKGDGLDSLRAIATESLKKLS